MEKGANIENPAIRNATRRGGRSIRSVGDLSGVQELQELQNVEEMLLASRDPITIARLLTPPLLKQIEFVASCKLLNSAPINSLASKKDLVSNPLKRLLS
jgi:hypothetical protein